MAYDYDRIVSLVASALAEQPTVKLNALAESLGIERHTICRALAKRVGHSFRSLQSQHIAAAAARRSDQGLTSTKEVAVAIGYSSGRALSRRLGRIRTP